MFKKTTYEALNKIAFDKGFLPYEFFTQLTTLEAIMALFKGETVYQVNNEYYTEF